MLLENQTSSPGAASAGAALLVAHLAQMLETARVNADTHYEVTKRLVAEASLLLELHLARSAGSDRRQHAHRGLARWQINRVRTFIDEHLTECTRVSDLSSLARSSPSYFSSAFKRTFGAPQPDRNQLRVCGPGAFQLAISPHHGIYAEHLAARESSAAVCALTGRRPESEKISRVGRYLQQVGREPSVHGAAPHLVYVLSQSLLAAKLARLLKSGL